MSSYYNRLRLRRFSRLGSPTITVADPTGVVGTTISTTFSSHSASTIAWSVTGANAALFTIGASTLTLIDSSVAGTYAVTLVATNTESQKTTSCTVTFTVTAGASLPSLTLTVSALTAYIIQCTFTGNAAYVSYEAALNGDYGLGRIPLPVNKQIGTRTPLETYDVQVRGITSGGSFGPWSNTQTVTMPGDDTGVLPGTTAAMADSLVESIGINLHLNHSGVWSTAYSSGWLPRLKTCGIRYGRTSFGGSAQANSYIADLFTACGMKFLLVLHALTSGVYDTTKLNNWLNTAQNTIGANHIVGFDGPNEVNRGWNGINGSGSTVVASNWAGNTVSFMNTLKTNIRARSAFNSIPIGGPSIWGRSTTAIDNVLTYNGGLGWGPYVDSQPIHFYNGGRRPTVGGVPLDSNQNGNPNAEMTLEAIIADHARLVQSNPAKPTFIGEQGWDATSSWDPSYAASYNVVSEVAQSKFTGRAILENYVRGVDKTYIYAWLNNNDAGNWNGMYNQNKDTGSGFEAAGTGGPPYTYNVRSVMTNVENIISIMADPGVTFTPGALDYSFTGAGATSDLHHRLFQKRNGHFFLVVVYDAISWKRNGTVGDVANLTASATLNIPSIPSNVKYYTPYTGTSSTNLGSHATYSLTVPDHLMILEITP